MIVFYSRELNEVVQTLLNDSSSDSSSSDDDNDLLLVHTLFPPKEVVSKKRVCLDELGEYEKSVAVYNGMNFNGSY